MLQELLLLALLTTSPAAADWPQFRGPGSRGHSQATGLPLVWNETENLNIAWKVPIPGRGWSSPVVRGERIWMTTALDELRSLRAIAVDVATGKIIHDVEIFRPAAWRPGHVENSYASPTPVIEEGRIYVHFGSYGTAALSTADARPLWTNQELRVDHEHGPGSSPILYEDLLLINFDGTDQRFVAALRKDTGELAWKAPRSVKLEKKGAHQIAFSTPVVVRWAGKPQLISTGAGQVSAYDPRTGEEIWRLRHDGYSTVPQPAFGIGMVFVDTGYIIPHLLGVRLGGRGDVTDTHVAWITHWKVPANSSPLVVGDRIFMVNDEGFGSWLDARTGEDLWCERLGGRQYRASPLYANGRIYTWSVRGKTVVIRAADKYEVLAVNQLDGIIRATPAIAGRAIYVRSEAHLYRIEKRDASVPQ